MNEIKAAHKRISGIVRAIDEIAFQASILTLKAAVEAAGDQGAEARWSAQAANETRALIERETGMEALDSVAEQFHRIRYAGPVAMKHPFSDPR
jgi:methyl-accepting chemotaxis protein